MAKPAKAASRARRTQQDMFALVVHASAAEEHETYPAGQRHTLIVIVRGKSPEDALTTAIEGMVVAGWRDHEVAQASKLSPDLDSSELGRLAASVEDAQATGLSITVLAEPVVDKRH